MDCRKLSTKQLWNIAGLFYITPQGTSDFQTQLIFLIDKSTSAHVGHFVQVLLCSLRLGY